MSKKKLDLSQTLAPLETEFYTLVKELKGDTLLFNRSIETFIHKYNKTPYQSLDELLACSTSTAYTSSQTSVCSMDTVLKELLP